jgi:hypothetical protein
MQRCGSAVILPLAAARAIIAVMQPPSHPVVAFKKADDPTKHQSFLAWGYSHWLGEPWRHGFAPSWQ